MAISDNIVEVIGKWLKEVALTEETYTFLVKQRDEGSRKQQTVESQRNI